MLCTPTGNITTKNIAETPVGVHPVQGDTAHNGLHFRYLRIGYKDDRGEEWVLPALAMTGDVQPGGSCNLPHTLEARAGVAPLPPQGTHVPCTFPTCHGSHLLRKQLTSHWIEANREDEQAAAARKDQHAHGHSFSTSSLLFFPSLPQTPPQTQFQVTVHRSSQSAEHPARESQLTTIQPRKHLGSQL